MIKANGRFFNSIAAANNYVETFTFGEDRLQVQIETIENCKMKIATRSTAYARLATKFFDDGSWRECKWTPEQFTELIAPLLAMKLTVTDMRDRDTLALQTIAKNWWLSVAESIKAEVKGYMCLRRIASVSSMFKGEYDDARNELNYCILQRILAKKSRQSTRRYASLMDWTNVLNSSNRHGPASIITFQMLKEARVWIGRDGILKAGFSVDSEGAVDESEGVEEGEEEGEEEEKPKPDTVTKGKKKRSKRSKGSIKTNPAERSTTVTIPSPKKNPPWANCRHCTNFNDIPETWREEVECEEPIDLLQGMYLLAAFTFSRFKICDRHYLLLCKRLQLVGTKPAVLAVRVKQLWNARADHLSLLEVVRNNRKWFKGDLLFSIASTQTTEKEARCSGALVPETEQERVRSSGALGRETTPSPSVLGDQYKEPALIVQVPTRKRTLLSKSSRSSKRLKRSREKNVSRSLCFFVGLGQNASIPFAFFIHLIIGTLGKGVFFL